MSDAPTDAPGATAATAGRRRRWRRRIPILAALVGLVVVATSVVLTHAAARSGTAEAPTAAEPAETATVTRTDLVVQARTTAVVDYGPTTRLAGRKPGVLTWIAAPGTVVGRGEALYRVDAQPVPLFLGDAPLYRPLADGVDGADVRLVQENLVALGHSLTVDGEYGPATERAVAAWRKELGLAEATGLQPGDVVVAAAPVRVRGVTAQPGGRGEGEIMTFTGTERTATATIDPAQQSTMAVGTPVSITASGLAGALTGTVVSLVPEAQSEALAGREAQKILAGIRFDDQQAAAALLDGTSVSVTADSERREDVLTVPVGALLALLEGGYAVEVVENGVRRLLAVTTGMFANGLVEVSGDGLTDGMSVVTTS